MDISVKQWMERTIELLNDGQSELSNNRYNYQTIKQWMGRAIKQWMNTTI